MTTYRMNEEHHGVEVVFDAKPSAKTLEKLKAFGFRWNKKGGYWYARQTSERVELAKQFAAGAAATAEPQQAQPEASEYGVTLSEGYMGATEWTGAQYANGKRLYGAELSKAIREALKRCGIGGCFVRVKTYSGGQSIDVTVKASEADFITQSEYADSQDPSKSGQMPRAYWLTTPEGEQIHRDAMPWGDADRCNAIFRHTADLYYAHMMKNIMDDGANYNNVRDLCRDGLKRKIGAIQKVLDAFNHDDSNGMVDYFDRHFYDDIFVKVA